MRRGRKLPLSIDREYMKRRNYNTPWPSISDLMAALMMLFLFISVGYNLQISKKTKELKEKSEEISKITADYVDNRAKIYEDLVLAFDSKLDEWKATIDKDTLTLRFNDPSLLFEVGSANLTPKFTYILGEFWVTYVEILSRHSSTIREVKIEGHTSSDWANSSIEESYFNNMRLSQERTRATLEACYRLTPQDKQQWIRSFVTANGMSFSRIIRDKNGNEDSTQSRRVEFTVVVDSRSSLDRIMGELKNDKQL